MAVITMVITLQRN